MQRKKLEEERRLREEEENRRRQHEEEQRRYGELFWFEYNIFNIFDEYRSSGDDAATNDRH